MSQVPTHTGPSRRRFMQSVTTAALASGVMSKVSPAAYAAGSDTLKIGLVGCGGRGTGAAVQALTADSNAKLVSIGDMFLDNIEKSVTNMGRQKDIADRVVAGRDHWHAGFDAYKAVIAESDVVLLGTPPHFRPMHYKAAVEAGRHVFAEKPVAVDAAGVRSCLETTELARKKGLVVVSGLCWRYDGSMRDMIHRIQEGQIGELRAISSTRFAGISGRTYDRTPEMTDMEYQIRNWYYYTWLSGDFVVEQFVHELDKISWLMGDRHPTTVTAVGGRQARSGPNSGHIYDHFTAIMDYEDGLKYYGSTRHMAGCSSLNRDLVHGATGEAELAKFTIRGDKPFRGTPSKVQMHQAEHNELFEFIRSGKPRNDGVYMSHSTLLAIMIRESAYTGKTIAWEQAMNSQQELRPSSYTRDGKPPEAQVAIPGITQFV